MSKVGIFRIGAGLALALSLCGCSTFQFAAARQETQRLLREGRAQEAADKVKDKALKESDDQIVYLFEYGTALQIASDFKASNEALLKADDLTDS